MASTGETQNMAGNVDRESRSLNALVILITAGIVLGLIVGTKGSRMPMLSVNDLSRWATVYSLGERGTYQIDQTPWPMTIDRIQVDGHSYSSKPPLLPTLLAGEYLLIKKVSFGVLNFDSCPETVIRILLVSVNLIPFVIFLLFYSRYLERVTSIVWVRSYSMLAAALGTYLTAYNITLNNHTLAASCSFFALYLAFQIWCEGQRKWQLFALAGFFAGFATVNEFPALSFLVALACGLALRSPKKTLLFFLPLALLPIFGHFLTNYAAMGSWKPAYAKKEAYDFPGSYWKIDPATGRLIGSRVDPTTGKTVLSFPEGIDNQYEPWPVYLFHMLLGHHGVFSLSPIFILSLLGIVKLLRSGASSLSASSPPSSARQCEGREHSKAVPRPTGDGAVSQPRPARLASLSHLMMRIHENSLWAFGMLAVILSGTLLIFYMFFAGQRNYGGICNGLRWLFWLIPLWLMFLPLGLEGRSSRRWFRAMALVFLLISAASAFYATRNPWTRPWLQEWMRYHQWITY